MKIIIAQPPNIDAIRAAFKLEHGVIFAYGDAIYNPDGVEVPAWKKVHENVHAQRQGATLAAIDTWWQRYLTDPTFRLAEEIPAHRAEFKAYRDLARKNRWDIAAGLHQLAAGLSSPLYGGIIRYQDAREAIRA